MELIQVSLNKSGAYFMESIVAARGMHGKTKGHVKEVLIIGVPNSQLQSYCERNDICITNKAVYISGKKVLVRKDNTMTYVEIKKNEK